MESAQSWQRPAERFEDLCGRPSWSVHARCHCTNDTDDDVSAVVEESTDKLIGGKSDDGLIVHRGPGGDFPTEPPVVRYNEVDAMEDRGRDHVPVFLVHDHFVNEPSRDRDPMSVRGDAYVGKASLNSCLIEIWKICRDVPDRLGKDLFTYDRPLEQTVRACGQDEIADPYWEEHVCVEEQPRSTNRPDSCHASKKDDSFSAALRFDDGALSRPDPLTCSGADRAELLRIIDGTPDLAGLRATRRANLGAP